MFVIGKVSAPLVRRSVVPRIFRFVGANAGLCSKGGASSGENQESQSSESSMRQQIVEKALGYVPTMGWTEDALAQAATDFGLPPLNHRIVSRGPVEIVDLFLAKKRIHVKEFMKAASMAREDDAGEVGKDETGGSHSDSDDDIVYKAIEAHLDFIAPYVPSWPSAISLMIHPDELPHLLELSSEVANDLCEYAGIKAARTDWYTERALLLSVFASTELYMLTDTSEGFTDTKDFLKRSLQKRSELRSQSPTTLFALRFGIEKAFEEVMKVAASSRK